MDVFVQYYSLPSDFQIIICDLVVVQGSKPIPRPLMILNQMSHFGGMLIKLDFS
jgi:hypothetical protein